MFLISRRPETSCVGAVTVADREKLTAICPFRIIYFSGREKNCPKLITRLVPLAKLGTGPMTYNKVPGDGQA